MRAARARAAAGAPAARTIAPGGPHPARRPFTNQRPVKRISLLLLLAGAALLLVDLWLYVGYTTTRRSTAIELTSIEAEIEAEREALATAERRLAEAEVAAQNELVTFMNRRIAERTFGWSVLFDRLAGLLPQDVRLDSLAPRFLEDDDRRNGRRAAAGDEPGRRVELVLQGRSRDGEAILELVDALFSDPAFADPDLSREIQQSGEVAFNLAVVYLPGAAEALAREAQIAAQAGSVVATPPDVDEEGGERDGGNRDGGGQGDVDLGGPAPGGVR